jgi:Domain of unknown function (DUF4145)
MAVNFDLWKVRFAKLPSWQCPTCQSGSLVLDTDSLSLKETGLSIDGRDEPAWEPEWITERFSGLLVCQNADCGDVSVIGGIVHYEEDHDWESQTQNWAKEFEPLFIYPSPKIFAVSSKCPEIVADELQKAFTLIWYDTSSSANSLRIAIEAMLNDKKIPRTTINAKHKRCDLSLHSRIEKFKKADSASADLLMAIKWLGNSGSHAPHSTMERVELLRGFEIFEHVIELVYEQSTKRLTKIAKSITARKGKPKRKKAGKAAF